MNLDMVSSLLEFIDNSPSIYHVVNNIKDNLIKNNYIELSEKEKWNISANCKYFVRKNDSAIIAFEIGNEDIEKYGFRIVGAHNDSPCFKIKPLSEISIENNYIKLNTEIYGSPIVSTWFDRPLSIAGRVIIKTDDIKQPETKLINIDRPVLIIPNLAIHFNRKVNNGYVYNNQKDLLPLISLINENFEQNNLILKLLSEELEIPIANILDFELFLYEFATCQLIGLNEDFISAGKLDDLWMVQSSLEGLLTSNTNFATKIAVYLNNEEVGNRTSEGSSSSFLETTLKRIALSLDKTEEEYFMSLANSFMISADLAHGVHPNYSEMHDPTNRPFLGKGIVVKYSSAKKYSTDAFSASVIIDLCQKNNILCQKFVNRSDLPGGSTMGNDFATKLSIPVADIGSPILSMHSIRELAASSDIEQTQLFFKYFFEM